MVSKIKTDVVETSLGKPVDLTGQSAAKAYGSYSQNSIYDPAYGGADVIGETFNVSSITDVQVGAIRPSFSNAMLTQRYSVVVQSHLSGETATYSYNYPDMCGALLKTNVKVDFGNSYVNGGAARDCMWNGFTVHGDLA